VRLLTLALVTSVVWSGLLPMRTTALALLLVWLPFTLISLLAGSALCRGHMKIKDAFHFEVLTGQIHFRALRCVIRPSRMKFKVTPKEGIDTGGLEPLRQIPVATTIAGLLCLGVLLRLVELAGSWSFLPTLPGAARWAVPIIAMVEARRLVRTLRHVIARNQRRLHYRFPCDLAATVETPDGSFVARLGDISPRGARIVLDTAPARGASLWLNVSLPNARGELQQLTLLTTVTTSFPAGDRFGAGLRFVELDDDAKQAVIEYCYLVRTFERLRGTSVAPAPTPAGVAAVPQRVTHSMPEPAPSPVRPEDATTAPRRVGTRRVGTQPVRTPALVSRRRERSTVER
jgi:hypothetical protein